MFGINLPIPMGNMVAPKTAVMMVVFIKENKMKIINENSQNILYSSLMAKSVRQNNM